MARSRGSSEPTYAQALAELEEIIGRIESEEIDVDALAEQVKRATKLIRFCREKLKNTDEDVKRALAEMEVQLQDNSVEKDLGLI
ncbi:MAG TPA: exodeoxyribonuclease VII small subunit [Dissulfurispiraceae bacterium]|nr:exodeoxyribonuclease VII small subunit [Dissulfurispiraceae bacterium]